MNAEHIKHLKKLTKITNILTFGEIQVNVNYLFHQKRDPTPKVILLVSLAKCE